MLVILRDMELQLPAGAILISPWVDLTHSFPSVAGDGSFDYIPAHGFLHRPSAAWPPPNSEDIEQIAMLLIKKTEADSIPGEPSQQARRQNTDDAVRGFSMNQTPENISPIENSYSPTKAPRIGSNLGNPMPGVDHDLSIMVDGKLIGIKDQIQLYTTNQLISHPLVSPVLTPTLGGLPPLLILTGGGELLRDEQIYLAHKAANPLDHAPSAAEFLEARKRLADYRPTNVQLQVWDDLCHVAPTLSFTRPAKYMYRSIAQFGAWALARAQGTDVHIKEDDEVSVISSHSNDEDRIFEERPKDLPAQATDKIGRVEEPLPAFKNHMIRQRVDRHGNIYPLGPPSSLPALQMAAAEIGVIKPGPVLKWIDAKQTWDTKYARQKRKVQKQRAREMAKGFRGFIGKDGREEVPPPSALAARRGLIMPKEEKKKKSWGMSLWSSWGSSHDEKTVSFL